MPLFQVVPWRRHRRTAWPEDPEQTSFEKMKSAFTTAGSDGEPQSKVNLATVVKQWRHGFLDMTVDAYLEFLDWNARRVVEGKAGAMDNRLPPILERLGMTADFWLRMNQNFDHWFGPEAGSAQG